MIPQLQPHTERDQHQYQQQMLHQNIFNYIFIPFIHSNEIHYTFIFLPLYSLIPTKHMIQLNLKNIKKRRIQILLMSSNCFDTHCSEGCCNYYGSCPDYSSTSTLSNQCYYHYDDFDSYWIIAPIVFAVFFIGFIVCFCIARKRQQNIEGNMEVAANTQVTTVNNQQNMGWNQPQPHDPFSQPPPYNNDPFSQPPPYNNDAYNQQPNQFQPPNQFQQANQFQPPPNQYPNPPPYNQGAFNPADNNYNSGNNYYQQQPYPGY